MQSTPYTSDMAKGYGSSCPVARTLDAIGERWTLLILRDLLTVGPCRFHELLTSLGGIAPTTLSARLKLLESEEIVARRLYSDHPPRAEYVLTEKGRRLGPVLKALRDWGKRYQPS